MPIFFHATFAAMPVEIFIPTPPPGTESIFEGLPDTPGLTDAGELRRADAAERPPGRLRHPDSVILLGDDDDDAPHDLVPLRSVQRQASPPVSRPSLPSKRPTMPAPAIQSKKKAPEKTRRICVKDVVMAYQLAASDSGAMASIRALAPSRDVVRAAVRTFRAAKKPCPGLDAYCHELGVSPEPLPPGRGRPKAGDVRTYVPQKVPKRDSYFIRLPLDYFHVDKDTRVTVEFSDVGMDVKVFSALDDGT